MKNLEIQELSYRESVSTNGGGIFTIGAAITLGIIFISGIKDGLSDGQPTQPGRPCECTCVCR